MNRLLFKNFIPFSLLVTLLNLSVHSQTQGEDINMSSYLLHFPAGGVGGATNYIKSEKLTNSLGQWLFESPYSDIVFNSGTNSSNPREIKFKIGNSTLAYWGANGLNFSTGGVGGATNYIKSEKLTNSLGQWSFSAPYSNIEFNAGTNSSNPREITFKIGTDPKLRINSSGLMATEVKVTLEGWSDFVFENGYELQPLDEVESYITKHKHLPEIPSEAEVIENGVNLGDMDSKLLQKIEELTLYLIEQNKKIEELTEKVHRLEND